MNVPQTNGSRRCPGCAQEFHVPSRILTDEFYEHCHSCEQFKKLDLFCKQCSMPFPKKRHLKHHQTSGCIEKAKPKWMSIAIYNEVRSSTFNSTIKCSECSKEFRCRRNGNVMVRFELNYYIHRVEECKNSKKLIKKCSKCSKVFINSSSLGNHMRSH